ncbi:MAG: transferrin receptor-like dimerization domain-containing protein, partial [Caulobacteraceae bacterium]
VYVNYGMEADYKELRRLGVSVKGKIAIVRYGAGWRGLKPRLAYEHGAVGCIIYSDPADDGYATNEPYPEGGSRPAFGIQRGSVENITLYSGDPLTPGWGATAHARRLPLSEVKVFQKIPVIPISWGDAERFLAAMSGPVAPKAWRGALPITYHVGPGTDPVHLAVQAEWTRKPIYDVIAVMKGSIFPDQWVIRGNHRDGWVYGAYDPLAGQTAEMEGARSLGELARTGWRPKRTIIYASWDGEEPGLLGSTEWAETHADELKKHAVLYLNSDTNNRGFLFSASSQEARHLLDGVASDVADPETGVSVKRRAEARLEVEALAASANPEIKALAKQAEEGGDIPTSDLGSGSDYTPFVQHLGIAAINIGYGGEDQWGVYHSAYDTYTHYERFGDPGLRYGVTLAQTAGRIVLRAADADLIPFRFDDYAAAMARQVKELETLLAKERGDHASLDRLLKADAFALAADPSLPHGAPEVEASVPDLNFAPLDRAVERLQKAAARYDAEAEAAPGRSDPAAIARADEVLQEVEQAMTDPRGLPGRPWYVNLMSAPGVLTGYGAKTLPGVREAIEAGRWAEAQEYIGRTAQALDRVSDRLDEANRILGG